MLNLLKYEVISRWKGMLGWGIGLTIFSAIYISAYPEMQDQLQAMAGISFYRMLGVDIDSFGGYIASIVVQYLALILSIHAVASGTGTLAGEEDRGTLELLLATPLKRWQIVTMKALALAIVTFIILLLGGIGANIVLAVISTMVEVDVTFMQFFAGILNAWPITMAITMIALFMGAYLPNRRIATVVMAVVVIGSYFLKILFNMLDTLAWLEPLSIFSYFETTSKVFREGVQPGDVAVLLVIAAIFFGLALLSFERRNVTVGALPWQRARAAK